MREKDVQFRDRLLIVNMIPYLIGEVIRKMRYQPSEYTIKIMPHTMINNNA